MSNDIERLWKLQTQVNRLVLEGKRNPNTLIDFYQRILEIQNKTIKTWKTIRLGTFKGVDEIDMALRSGGYSTGDWGDDILRSLYFEEGIAKKLTLVDLVVLSNADLGFKDGACLLHTYEKAVEYGLSLCPAEVGPQLRLQYKDQPSGEQLLVAMKGIVCSDTRVKLFNVQCIRDNERWLDGAFGALGKFWSGDTCFVFIHNKVA